ncbi:MAG: autotransporter-associated beta strand repeat-containing protein [Planctomycetaceae bacterium]|jgi:autotransporter-associated beta strand protein/predicted outer membrane repeat protein|nr:autotransporter-associated beta strand repeat-containing protein [Planctomycetaceae bacterium]
MSRNFVRLSALIFVFGVMFCAAAWAQISSKPIIYRIWDRDNLPNSSPNEKYYRYLSRPDGVSVTQSGLYQVAPNFGSSVLYYTSDRGYYYAANQQTNLILHNDDSTLLNQTFELGYNNNYYYNYDYYNDPDNPLQLTIQSNTPGTLRKLIGTNASLFHLWSNSELTISKDILVSKKEDIDLITGGGTTIIDGIYYNSYRSDAGAIYLQGGALNAEGVSFSSCFNTNILNYSSSANSSNVHGKGGALTADSRYYYYYYYDETTGEYYYDDSGYDINAFNKVINVNKAKFTENHALIGGAIYMNQYTLNGNETMFRSNIANKGTTSYGSGDGGAIYLIDSTATLESATFSNNTANNNGGAIYSENSNLFLKGTDFTMNNAAGLGGAIFFAVNDGSEYVLQLGAFQGTSVEFTKNKQNYDPIANLGSDNSIMFGYGSTLSATGTANVNVDVEGKDNNFNMNDPMAIDGGNIHLRFIKTGEGVWNLYGNSNLTQASSVLFNIDRGTFRLGNDAVLNLPSGSGPNQFNVRSNATLSIGAWAGSDYAVTLSTPHFQMDAGSKLLLDQTLNLNVLGNENIFKGTLTGTGDLIVNIANVSETTGTLKFSGQTSNYSGNLEIQSGTFWVDSGLQTTGLVELAAKTTLSVTANSNKPNITAQNISIGNEVALQINGIIGTTRDFIILDSENPITGKFIDDPDLSLNVDYLQATFEFTPDSDYKQYRGTVRLTWDSDDSDDSNGTFTIDPFDGQADYFKVERELEDNTLNGKKLTKKGPGTLELADANEYRGGTLIESGTLLLTNAKGTGTGDVQIDRYATLTLNFDGNYDRQISGQGQVTKTGSATTAILTNTSNDYSGGTRLETGTLGISNGKVLGSGDLTFVGGILQAKSQSGETNLTQNIVATTGNDVQFETVTDLTVAKNSTISGQGGLIKTGNGKLTLAGKGAYHGITRIKKGILSIASVTAVGSGKIVFDDGTTFENTADLDNYHHLTLNAAENVQKINAQNVNNAGVIFNVLNDWNQTGLIDGDGMLVKSGTGTMTISGNNSYSGGTRIKLGVLEFSVPQNLGSGQIIFDGGILRNLQDIDDFAIPMTTGNGHSFIFETPHDLTITSRLSGSGGLTKTGSGTLTLAGNNDYWGNTLVKNGVLKIDGELQSEVTVNSGAVLTGSGIIDSDVNFKPGAIYQWNFGIREEDSPYLNIRGAVNLSGTIFQPVTVQDAAQEHYPDKIDGWTIMRYGNLEDNIGFEEYIDNELNPFYDFTLDYSTPYRIKVIGYHRRDPRPLSDSVAMGIVLPQRKVSRRAFEQIDNELQNGRYLGLRSITRRPKNQVRGQSASSVRHVWGNFYGRSSEFESSYHKNDSWRLNSFGLQVGYSFLSANWLSFGVTAGVEIPQLKNGRDKIDASDGFLGLYFGKRIYGLWELKGYLGGGTQNYTSYRNDTKYTYRSKYRGDSFETNLELGRPILFGTLLVRPHFGFDLEYAAQQGATENKVSSEYRTYSNASLSQFYFRVGIDLEKRLSLGEVFLGIDYANMIGGQTLPNVRVYYPAVKSGTTVYGTTLGQNIVSIRGGGNYYLNAVRSKALFMNLTGDIFADRAGGQCGFTATFGYDYRF